MDCSLTFCACWALAIPAAVWRLFSFFMCFPLFFVLVELGISETKTVNSYTVIQAPSLDNLHLKSWGKFYVA